MGIAAIKAQLFNQRASEDHAIIDGENFANLQFTRTGSSLFQCPQANLNPALVALNQPVEGASTRLVISPARTGGHVATLVQQPLRSKDPAVDPQFYTLGNVDVCSDEYIDLQDESSNVVVLATGALTEQATAALGLTRLQVQLWKFEDHMELHLILA